MIFCVDGLPEGSESQSAAAGISLKIALSFQSARFHAQVPTQRVPSSAACAMQNRLFASSRHLLFTWALCHADIEQCI